MSKVTTFNRRVAFNPSVSCVHIMSIEDYTPKERSATWFNENEMDRITQRCFKIVTRMNAAKSGRHCIRGLEGYSTVGSLSKKNNRLSAIAAVLIEQANQWVDARVDEQAIANAYQRTTSSCQMWAQVMGKRDQQAAESIFLKEHEDGAGEEGNRSCSPSGSLDSVAKISTKHSPSTSTSLAGRPLISSKKLHTILQPSRLAITAWLTLWLLQAIHSIWIFSFGAILINFLIF